MGGKGGRKERDESREVKRERGSLTYHKSLLETWEKYHYFSLKKKKKKSS